MTNTDMCGQVTYLTYMVASKTFMDFLVKLFYITNNISIFCGVHDGFVCFWLLSCLYTHAAVFELLPLLIVGNFRHSRFIQWVYPPTQSSNQDVYFADVITASFKM